MNCFRKKQTIKDIQYHMKNGATLTKKFSIWIMNLTDGRIVFNFRNGSIESFLKKNEHVIIEQSTNSLTIKLQSSN
jgi:hypothetical protein